MAGFFCLGCLALDWFPWILERAVPLVSPNTQKRGTLNSQSRSSENRIGPPRLVSFWFPLKHPRGLRNHVCLCVFLFGWRNWFPCGFSLKPKNGNQLKNKQTHLENAPPASARKNWGLSFFRGTPPPKLWESFFGFPFSTGQNEPHRASKKKDPALGAAKRAGRSWMVRTSNVPQR